jgi:hypothetical protein
MIENSLKSPLSRAATSPIPRPIPQPVDLPIARNRFFGLVLVATLVFLATVLVAEGIARLTVGLALPLESHDKGYDAKYYLAKRLVEKGQPLIILSGTSLSDWGVYPELLRAELQQKGYRAQVRNLSSMGNTAEQSIFLLKTAIDAGNRPKLVVFDLNPLFFNKAYLEDDQKPLSAGGLFAKSYMGGCLAAKPQEAFAKMDCGLKKASYLYRYRSFFKDQLTALPEALLKPAKRQKLDFKDHPYVEISLDGWRPAFPVHTSVEFDEMYREPPPYMLKQLQHYGQFRFTDETLVKMAAFCKRENIPMIALWTPQHPLMNRYYAKYKLSQGYFEERFKAVTASQGIPFLNLRQAVQDPALFYNPDHLNALGAIALTRQLADRLTTEPTFTRVIPREAKP